jgi:hypothetical protein
MKDWLNTFLSREDWQCGLLRRQSRLQILGHAYAYIEQQHKEWMHEQNFVIFHLFGAVILFRIVEHCGTSSTPGISSSNSRNSIIIQYKRPTRHWSSSTNFPNPENWVQTELLGIPYRNYLLIPEINLQPQQYAWGWGREVIPVRNFGIGRNSWKLRAIPELELFAEFRVIPF